MILGGLKINPSGVCSHAKPENYLGCVLVLPKNAKAPATWVTTCQRTLTLWEFGTPEKSNFFFGLLKQTQDGTGGAPSILKRNLSDCLHDNSWHLACLCPSNTCDTRISFHDGKHVSYFCQICAQFTLPHTALKKTKVQGDMWNPAYIECV